MSQLTGSKIWQIVLGFYACCWELIILMSWGLSLKSGLQDIELKKTLASKVSEYH